jgi:DNA-binding CsgD family transcriptional regulator
MEEAKMERARLPCARCGRENRPDAAYCDACGSALSGSATERAPAPAAIGSGTLFVGRARELRALRDTLDQTLRGRGRVAMLAGDPGIGKTHTAEMLARHAGQLGVEVLWGRCYEEPGAPPYWPWVKVIRGYAAGRDADALRAEVGAGLDLIADVVPELAEKIPALRPGAMEKDPQARLRLLEAIAGLWKRAAQDRPQLLILDNLHWADAPSLRLLEFLAAEITASRLMVLGTYRDIELSRQHPLSNSLGELARHACFVRLRLTGLTHDETGQFIAAASGQAPSSKLLSEVHAQTEGNPLFVAEMTRFLMQDGTLASAPLRIPEGIREVIGTRLNRLSAACNEVLAAAAVIGRSFSRPILDRLLDPPALERCGAALEEALAASMIEERATRGTFQFRHALIRETLYEEQPATRRSDLHLRIGAALEALYGHDPAPHLSAFAHHYCAALPGGDALRAADYARRAAEHADRLFAPEEAVRLYRLALQALDGESPVPAAQRLGLQIALGSSLVKAGENLPALRILEEVAGSAKALGLAEELARAARAFEAATWRPGLSGTTAARLLGEALSGLGEGDSILKAQVLASFARALIFSGEGERGVQVSAQAVAMARRLGDLATIAVALRSDGSARGNPGRLALRIANASEAVRLAEEVGDKEGAAEASAWRLLDMIEVGDLHAVSAELTGFAHQAEELHQPFYRYMTVMTHAMLALARGRFEESERRAKEALALGRNMPSLEALGVYGVQIFSLRREQGRLGEIVELLAEFVRGTPQAATWRPGLAAIYAELGMRREARATFDAVADRGFASLPRDASWVASLSYLAEVCVFLGDAAHANELYRFLAPYDGINIVASPNVACYGAAARFLGMLATTMGHWEDAQRHFESALEANGRQDAWPWLAHTRYRYAEMLVARSASGDRERALQLLDEALGASRELGMAALCARADGLARTLAPAQRVLPVRYPAGLSRREVDVLKLVALGKANREIGERLFLSPNTVANHMRSILTKTNTANRAEAAAFAVRNALLEE